MSFRLSKRLVILVFILLSLPLRALQVTFTSSNLPVIVIDTHGIEIPDDERIVADMGIIWHEDESRNALADSFNNYSGKIAIELRGSSSQMFPKKQYALETQDVSGENLNVSLLGMPAENDWILYAPYSDKSLMRNVLAYNLSRDIGRYASRTAFCELILNDDYRGVYVLMEKVKRDQYRIDISKLNPWETSGDDLTGGYIFKLDKFAGEQIDGWESPYLAFPESWANIFYQYHYPKPDEIVAQQASYIKDLVDAFENVMFSAGYADPVNGYAAYIDVSSFIDYFVLNEICKNVDGYRLSMFLCKDKNSIDDRIRMGPIWDFNLAFGNANYYDAGMIAGWQYNINTNARFRDARDIFQVPFWWEKLVEEAVFRDRIYCRWQALREDIFSIPRIHAAIDNLELLLDEAQQRNFQRWPILGTWVWPNQVVFDTYEEEVQHLKNWIYARILWIDTNLPGNCVDTIPHDHGSQPGLFNLAQNYPNPFNGHTNISYSLNVSGPVRIQVTDVNGRIVSNYFVERQMQGTHEFIWSAKDDRGIDMASGVYFYTLRTKDSRRTNKMLLIR